MAFTLDGYAQYLRGLAVGTFRGLDLRVRTDVEVSVDDKEMSITVRCLDAPDLFITRQQIEDNDAERMVIAHFMLLPFFKKGALANVSQHVVLEAIKRLQK